MPCARAKIARMRALLKFLMVVVLLAAVCLGGAWWWAGRMSGPSIDLKQPDRFVGQTTSMELTLQAPEGRFAHASVTLSQNGVNHDVFTLEPQAGAMPRIAGGKLDVLRDEPLRRELADFVAAARERRSPGVTGRQGRAALVLANEIVSRMG